MEELLDNNMIISRPDTDLGPRMIITGYQLFSCSGHSWPAVKMTNVSVMSQD